MKSFSNNLSYGMDVKLQVPPLTYKINGQLCMYIYDFLVDDLVSVDDLHFFYFIFVNGNDIGLGQDRCLYLRLQVKPDHKETCFRIFNTMEIQCAVATAASRTFPQCWSSYPDKLEYFKLDFSISKNIPINWKHLRLQFVYSGMPRISHIFAFTKCQVNRQDVVFPWF